MLMVVAGCGSGAPEVLTVEDEQIYDVDVAGVVRDIERASSQPAGRTTGGPFSAVAAGPGTVTLANDNSFSFGTDTPIGNFCDDGLPDSTRPVCYVAGHSNHTSLASSPGTPRSSDPRPTQAPCGFQRPQCRIAER
ncbi:MAG TPA: hypothetical protein VMM60_05945 [Ilumatobacter sp.]|nr:hypothetical protein [Ilumatobacter sp.]